jgi:hypothetical protein
MRKPTSLTPQTNESLKAARLLMVLSSISPLFIFWAIRGNKLISNRYFIGFCSFMIVIPNAFLLLRIRAAIRARDKRQLTVGSAEDHREHLLSYLFAMLLPFYAPEFNSWRGLAAVMTAVAFIVFLFWHLNMHHMNVLFAMQGYRVFTVYPPDDSNVLTGKSNFVLITRRVTLSPGTKVDAYRLSDTVYMDTNK